MSLWVGSSNEGRRNGECVQAWVGSECKGGKDDENNGGERCVDRSLREGRHRGLASQVEGWKSLGAGVYGTVVFGAGRVEEGK